MINPNESSDDQDNRLLTPEEQQSLLDEASKTISGLDRGVDPRDSLMLAEENARLDKIAEEIMKYLNKD